jgi:hypothetical protein
VLEVIRRGGGSVSLMFAPGRLGVSVGRGPDVRGRGCRSVSQFLKRRNVVPRGYRPGMNKTPPVITGRPRRFEILITLPCAGPDPSDPAAIVAAIEHAATLAPAGGVIAACTAKMTIVSMAAAALDADSAVRVAEGVVRAALGVEELNVVEVIAGPV